MSVIRVAKLSLQKNVVGYRVYTSYGHIYDFDCETGAKLGLTPNSLTREIQLSDRNYSLISLEEEITGMKVKDLSGNLEDLQKYAQDILSHVKSSSYSVNGLDKADYDKAVLFLEKVALFTGSITPKEVLSRFVTTFNSFAYTTIGYSLPELLRGIDAAKKKKNLKRLAFYFQGTIYGSNSERSLSELESGSLAPYAAMFLVNPVGH